MGNHFLPVFKGTLLLNVLMRYVSSGFREIDLVKPSKENIIDMFKGTIEEERIVEMLVFLNDKKIIEKTPDGLFQVYMYSGTSSKELEKEIENKKIQYGKVENILSRSNDLEDLKNTLGSAVNREMEFLVLDVDTPEHILKTKINKKFINNYKINICLFLSTTEEKLKKESKKIESISNDEDFKNIIFLVSEASMGEEEYNKFIEYSARAEISGKQHNVQDRKTNEEYARKILYSWIHKIKNGYVEYFFQGMRAKRVFSKMGPEINSDFTNMIFPYGLNKIEFLNTNKNIWKKVTAKKSIEIFLFANDRAYVENNTKGSDSPLKNIIKDNNGEYIVDINLKIKKEIDSHPLKKMQLEVNKVLEESKMKGEFNLASVLQFLSRSPFGLYSSKVNMAAMGFLMRDYVDKLFNIGTGTAITKEIMRDRIVDMFSYWEKKSGSPPAKLNVRFGTEDEKELINNLKDIFSISDAISLNDIRWKIREDWSSEKGYPVWVFKYSEDVNEKTKKAIQSIYELIHSTDSDLHFDKIKEINELIKETHMDLSIQFTKNAEDARSVFKKWLEIKAEIIISSDTEMNDLMEYLKKNLQESVGKWEEDKVTIEALKWVNSRKSDGDSKEDPLSKPMHMDSRDDMDDPTYATKNIPKDSVEKTVSLIEGSPKEQLTKILKFILERHPYLIEDVKKIMGE